MVMKFLEGDVKGSLDIQLKYMDVIHNLFSEVNPIPAKRAVAEMGYCKNNRSSSINRDGRGSRTGINSVNERSRNSLRSYKRWLRL